MDDDVRQFGDLLGRKILVQDWASVHGMLAPWLRQTTTVAEIRTFFEEEYRRALEANSVQSLQYPAYPDPEVGGNNFMNATKLREPIEWAGGKVREVAPEVTDANVRFWLSLKLLCSDEQMAALGFDTFSETWIAVVGLPEGLRVGYWSQGAY